MSAFVFVFSSTLLLDSNETGWFQCCTLETGVFIITVRASQRAHTHSTQSGVIARPQQAIAYYYYTVDDSMRSEVFAHTDRGSIGNPQSMRITWTWVSVPGKPPKSDQATKNDWSKDGDRLLARITANRRGFPAFKSPRSVIGERSWSEHGTNCRHNLVAGKLKCFAGVAAYLPLTVTSVLIRNKKKTTHSTLLFIALNTFFLLNY